jgi:hypothetical protein
MNPVQEGFALEDLIYKASLNLPNLTHSKRENEIKTHFADNSLNGVDHWIQVGNTHIFIQDKWKESMGQQEVSQFINCVNRIKTRFVNTSPPNYMNIRLMWVSKYEPTSNAMKCLKEESVKMVTCDTTIEELARKAIFEICEHFKVNPSVCLDVIPMKGGRDNQLLDNIDQIKLEQEARELLQIKKELIEKKKKEEEQNKKDEAKVKELLQQDKALACYLALHGGNCHVHQWKPEHYSVKNLLEGYNIIEKFRESIEPKIKEIIQEYMKELWDNANTYDMMMYTGPYGAAPSDRYTSCCGKIISILQKGDNNDLWHHNPGRGWNQNPPPPPIFWKRCVAESIYTPLLNYELKEWTKYVTKFIELSKNPNSQPSPKEARVKIKSLEDEITSLKARNDILQKKLDTIRSAL